MLLEKDTEGKTVTYEYDDDGRVIARTNENGHTTRYDNYDDENKESKITDALGNYRIISYDSGGRWTREEWFTQTGLLIKEQGAVYGAAGNIIAFFDGESNRTTYDYDGRGNIIEQVDAYGYTTSWEYDTDNNLIRETDARGNITEYDYVNRNLVETKWYIDGQPVTETRTYYSDGLLESVTDARGRITTYEYDEYGNQTKISEPLGKETTFTYDIMGRMLTKTEKIDDSTSRTTTYEYNLDGKQTKIIYEDGSYEEFHYDCCDIDWKRDRNGNYTYYTYNGTHNVTAEMKGDRITEYEYDENDNLSIITVSNEPYNPQITEYSYDVAGRRMEEKRLGSGMDLITQFTYNGVSKVETKKQKLDDRWITTRYYYDDMNRVSEIIAPMNAETQYGYDANGNQTSVTNAEGRTTYYDYDERNRLITTINALGVRTKYVLDKVGNRTAIIEEEGTELERTTNYEYDALNRLITIIDSFWHGTTISYSYLNNKKEQTDANGNATTFVYDSNGRQISKTNAEGHITEFEYDNNGNRTRIIDPNGNWTTFSYNEFNKLISTTYADGSAESYTYDKVGNKLTKTTRTGELIQFTYDEFNRLVTKTYPDSSTADFSYDQLRRMMAASNDSAEYEFSYNDINQLEQVDVSIGSDDYTVAYDHDLVGNKTGITYPSGEVYIREYDDLNQLDQVIKGGEILADYSYNALNQRIRRDYLNGTWTTYTYNEAGWLENLTNWRTETDVISKFSYTNDNVGNRTSMTTLDGNHDYEYDKIYELTEVDYPDGYPFSDKTYNYDAAWNRTTMVNGGTEEYLSNERNQYTEVDGVEFDYDLNGNLTTDGPQTYYYDCENQLTKVVRNSDGATLGEYKYDPFGKRIQKEVEGGSIVNYVYDHTSYQVLAEYEDDGGGFDLARSFIYGVGIDEPLMMVQDEEQYFYYRDGLGSVTNLTSSTVSTDLTYNYSLYGDFSQSGTLSGNPCYGRSKTPAKWPV